MHVIGFGAGASLDRLQLRVNLAGWAIGPSRTSVQISRPSTRSFTIGPGRKRRSGSQDVFGRLIPMPSKLKSPREDRTRSPLKVPLSLRLDRACQQKRFEAGLSPRTVVELFDFFCVESPGAKCYSELDANWSGGGRMVQAAAKHNTRQSRNGDRDEAARDHRQARSALPVWRLLVPIVLGLLVSGAVFAQALSQSPSPTDYPNAPLRTQDTGQDCSTAISGTTCINGICIDVSPFGNVCTTLCNLSSDCTLANWGCYQITQGDGSYQGICRPRRLGVLQSP
jgi:hypothetical protein